MAKKSVRVSLRIYQHEMPNLYSKAVILESYDRSRFVRRELLVHELFGYDASHLRNTEPTTTLTKHYNIVPVEGDKLLYDDDIVL